MPKKEWWLMLCYWKETASNHSKLRQEYAENGQPTISNPALPSEGTTAALLSFIIKDPRSSTTSQASVHHMVEEWWFDISKIRTSTGPNTITIHQGHARTPRPLVRLCLHHPLRWECTGIMPVPDRYLNWPLFWQCAVDLINYSSRYPLSYINKQSSLIRLKCNYVCSKSRSMVRVK